MSLHSTTARATLFFLFTLLIIAINSIYSFALGCTGIQLKAKDGSVVNGRTAEFGLNLNLSGLVIPRNYHFKGTLPDGGVGLIYTSKYAVVGTSMFGEHAVADGLNEKGLAVGAFYFPSYAGYAVIRPNNKPYALSPTEFPTWILAQFSTINEVKQGINKVIIAPTVPKGWPVLPPFHYVVYDNTGKSIVIEPIKGELKIYDNPLGVLTNSPSFDWHMTNLSSYINLSPINTPPIDIEGVKLQQFGEGSGLHGLPGDFTPPSRFIRAVVFASTAIPSSNAEETVKQLFHILNQFDIPVGSVRSIHDHKVIPEYTLATIVRDPNNLKYYFKTFNDQSIKVINLKSFNLNDNKIKEISMQGTQQIIDVSSLAK